MPLLTEGASRLLARVRFADGTQNRCDEVTVPISAARRPTVSAQRLQDRRRAQEGEPNFAAIFV